MLIPLYLFAIIALIVGTAAIYMALIRIFPVQWLYYHYFIRKPIVWSIFLGSILWVSWITLQTNIFPLSTIFPITLMGLAVLLSYKMHQENAFKAVDYPTIAEDVSSLPLKNDMQLVLIEYDGITKAYPLDYVIHHHVVNDEYGEKTVALTYCAMCRSIIAFDVTDIGPLFVGSFKNANMIVADRRTKTFFQQTTFDSIIGRLHPHTLTMIPSQILSWCDIKTLKPIPQVVKVTQKDFRAFQLPIPGIWKKIIKSEATPGLAAKERDKSFPARTHVVGIIDKIAQSRVVYLKEELIKHGITLNEDLDVFFVAANDAVLAFKNPATGKSLHITIEQDSTLCDEASKTVWDIRGKHISGEIESDLVPIGISDEYWFSWKKFHPESKLIRI